MKDAFGGILNLVFIVVFLLLVIGVLGLVVSYTKAFKMKNEVISTIERYEGTGCVTQTLDFDVNSECISKIKESAKSLAYSTSFINCPSGFTSMDGVYCYLASKKGDYLTVRVITQVDIDLPIINIVFGFSIFQVAGDTHRIYFKPAS